jgi:hypothetical protein
VTERIFDPHVQIDGPIAQVWAYFTVHVGKFPHGVAVIPRPPAC